MPDLETNRALIEIVLLAVIAAVALCALGLQIFWRPRRAHAELITSLPPWLEHLHEQQLRFEELLRYELGQSRQVAADLARQDRTELAETLRWVHETLYGQLGEGQRLQADRLQTITGELTSSGLQMRETTAQSASRLRQEIGEILGSSRDALVQTVDALSRGQHERLQTFSERLDKLSASNETKLEQLRGAIETKLSELREENSRRLEEMRVTVDEKLQGALEKRLGESFKQVSERLELVHRGLGEMQTLAVGVGDLKKVLTNVKTRGGWGEVQLGALLEQMLTPAQFERNVQTRKESAERVEYGIKLPGRGEGAESAVWLPVDSKFPLEDYQRLVEAQERADLPAVEESMKALRLRAFQCAREISTKYLSPPDTTDFAIMFVPTEGLFAEIIRQPGVVEELQGRHRVVIAGPTTFAALLNSLQMGFRTLTIQKQSSEVWKVLSEVRTEFGRFGEAVDAVKKKLQEASNKMDDVGKKSRAVERRLRDVSDASVVPQEELVDLVSVAPSELPQDDPSRTA